MIQFFAKHPTAANLLMIIMLVAGLLSVGSLQRETFPDALPTVVEVTVVYPGATAEQIEETIVRRLEDNLDGVQSLKEMTGVARHSTGSVSLEMKDGGDYSGFRNEIDNAVNSINDFPDDAEAPVITRLNTRQPVLDVLVSGDMQPTSLKAYCEQLRERLINTPGISDVLLDGFSDPLLRVELQPLAIQRYGLSPVIIANALSQQSIDVPAGKIETTETYLVRVEERRNSRIALEDTVVGASRGGAEILLRDVATITEEFELDEEKLIFDGVRGAVLKVQKAKSEDALKVAGVVRDTLEAERSRQPQIELTILNDQSSLVQDRISLLIKNGCQGCVLVFAVMWLFFNARLSFWVVASLPVSFLAAFALVPTVGLTINMLTMVGLLMALGLLMDDGIVIAENIASRRATGEPAMSAAINGVQEVAGGVLSSFLTTCSVLGPLIFLNGEIGKILRVLPMMLLLVLATSLIEAFLILPAHLGHSLERADKTNAFRRACDRLVDLARDAVGSLVSFAVAWRYLTAGCVMMTFLLTISLLPGGYVRFNVFPELEGDTIVARVLLPPGTPLSRTEAVVRQLERGLWEANEHFKPLQPGQQDLVQVTFARFSQNLDAEEVGPHVATVQADLLTNELREASIPDVIRKWRDAAGSVPDALSITFDEPALGPTGRDLELQLSGVELDQLKAAATEIESYLATFAGVSNVSNDLRLGEREVLVRLLPGAAGLDLTSIDVAQQLRGSFQGLLSDQIQIGRDSIDIEVRFGDDQRSSLNDLEDYRLSLPGGQTVPLSEVAKLEERRGWSSIRHADGRRVVSVFASVDSNRSNATAVLGLVQKEVLPDLQERFPRLRVAIKGASEKGKETGQSMAAAAVIGCLGVFVILSFQFRSYIEPLIVMGAIPFAFVGVVWGHLALGQNLSLPSIMGYASLCGIVVNDSILLVLFLKNAVADGVSVIDAAVESSRRRFRAVMITSLTTVAGLLPLLAEQSLQAQILIPIAISICFGLIASTLMVLIVIPPLYVILSDFGFTRLQHAGESESRS
ncbi:MAG: efflux RND transporter permease subunit [Planctomycetota bacterium]